MSGLKFGLILAQRFFINKNVGLILFILCIGLSVKGILYQILLADPSQENLKVIRSNKKHEHSHPNYLTDKQHSYFSQNPFEHNDMLRYPEVETNNYHWKLLRFGRLELYIYRHEAYYDQRTRGPHRGDTVRIMVVSNENLKKYNFSCQFWESEGSEFRPMAAEIPVKVQRNVNVAYGYPVNPFLISCPVPPNLMPDKVALLLGDSLSLPPPKWNSSSIPIPKLKIWNSYDSFQDQPKNFAVCVKGLSFPDVDLSLRLVEWFEMLKILEADKVYMYIYSVMPDVEKVLDHYAEEGFVDYFQLNLPGKLPNEPYQRQKFLRKYDNLYNANFEVVAWNDCFFRNLNNYKYFVPIDTDELIVPTTANFSTWTDIMDFVEASFPDLTMSIATYNIYNEGYFLEGLPTDYIPGVPKYMHMLQHVYYTSNGKYSVEWSRKGIIDAKKPLYLWNHWIWDCIEPMQCGKLQVPLDVATRLHYTKWGRLEQIAGEKKEINCERLNPGCLDYEEYGVLHRWGEELVERVTNKATLIGLPLKDVEM